MATTQAAMILRLRRLIDDVGHAYSQSAPGFSLDLSAVTAPVLYAYVDDDTVATALTLLPVAGLTSGPAIAAAIQRALRAAFPAVLGYANAVCTFHRADGYVIRSGSYGSHSRVEIVPGAGDDVSAALRLGLANGGYESESHLDFSDEDLGILLDDGLNYQNGIGDITAWEYETLPAEYETVVAYRAWSSVVDARLGRSASFYPQKVASEETSANVIFDNYFKLAKWLRDRIDEMVDQLSSHITCHDIVRWEPDYQAFVGDNSYYQPAAKLNAVLVGDVDEAIVEFEPILTTDCKRVFVAYNSAPGVWDQTLMTEADFVDPGPAIVAAAAPGTVVARELRSMKYPLVKITGLAPGVYYFAIQVTDQNGNRYFSNEMSVDLT